MNKIDYQHHIEEIKQHKIDMQNIRHKGKGKKLDPYMNFSEEKGKMKYMAVV
jgi:hypothetical protein